MSKSQNGDNGNIVTDPVKCKAKKCIHHQSRDKCSIYNNLNETKINIASNGMCEDFQSE
jgi:hypothetical protein